MRAAVAWIGALTLGLAGCGSSDRTNEPSALLVVEQVLAGNDLYIEGSRSYVSAEPRDGGDALTAELSRGRKPTASLKIAPGDYMLRSWQRPCAGNCGLLDPPTDRCSATFGVVAGAELRMRVELRPGTGCRIAPTR